MSVASSYLFIHENGLSVLFCRLSSIVSKHFLPMQIVSFSTCVIVLPSNPHLLNGCEIYGASVHGLSPSSIPGWTKSTKLSPRRFMRSIPLIDGCMNRYTNRNR